MNKYNFVHLHNHTEYSLLDGLMQIGPMVEKAKNCGMKAVSITDHGNMYGIIEFYQACKKHGIKPIIGSEFYMTPFSRFEKSGPRYHLVLLAKSETGYKNLLKLSSKSFIEGFYYKPRIDRELLEKYHEGLICLSACLQGEIPSLIIEGKINEAENTANYFKELFGSNSFFLEVQIHGIKDETTVAKALYTMSRKLKIPLVATNDAHYLNKEDAEAHDILLCIGTKKSFHDTGRMRFYGEEFYFKTEEEMYSVFKEIPRSLSNSYYISEMCELELELPGPILPEFEVPSEYTKESYLKEITYDGIIERYGKLTPELEERAEMELGTINRMGFPGYFLIVWDFIRYSKKNEIWVGPGRGSGAGSLVAYSLGITNIDPLEYGLIFERFLNEQRVSMPDFDIDFCKERRQEVIEYVTKKYTKEKVSQIVTFSKMNAKAVIRDVGRVLDIPLQRVDEIVKMLPEGKNLKKEIRDDSALFEILMYGREEEKRWLDTSIKLEGICRHTSLHAAGVVIGKKQITEYVPLQVVKDEKTGDLITTQFPGPQLEACGLVKMDFLGLITLTLLRNCISLLEKKGIFIDLDKLDLNDQKVYSLFSEGNTDAIFQFESPGMKKFLKKLQPTQLEDLIAMNALYRPGPMKFIDTYIDRKHGKEEVEYDHELIKPILEETYGIMIYQEQVMKIAQVLAGYSLGNADILRRAMGKKKLAVMKEHELIFINGCAENNIPEDCARRIYEKMIEFANYGFNKSHSTAYAYLAYQCAYLKTYYPAEFMASVLSSEIGKPDKLLEYVSGIKELGIEILPPDVNYSDVVFTVEDNKIRYALSGIKGCGDTASHNIVKMHTVEKKFKDFYHFLQTIDLRVVNRAVLEILIKSGALDSFGQKRKWMFEHLDDAIADAQSIQADKKIGQGQLFDIIENNISGYDDIKTGVGVEEWPLSQILSIEKETLGFYISGHPLDPYLPFIRNNCTESSKTIKKLELRPNGNYFNKVPVIMAGIIENPRIFNGENNTQWAILNVEDTFGKFNVYVYKKEFEQFGSILVKNKLIFIKGTCTQNKKGEKIVAAQFINDLEKCKIEDLSEFHVYLKEMEVDNNSLESFKNELAELNGKLSLFFHVKDSERDIVIKAMNIKAPKDLSLCEQFAAKYKFINKIKIV